MVLAEPIAHRASTTQGEAMTTTHRISIGVLLALVLAATAGPALARPFDINAHGSYVPAGSVSMRVTTPSAPPPVVRVTTTNGFDWGDAGIGAAGGLALSMIAVGGVLAVSQHRTRRTRDTTALTG
jgi:hypothetical protein